jgi:hypothetical protein
MAFYLASARARSLSISMDPHGYGTRSGHNVSFSRCTRNGMICALKPFARSLSISMDHMVAALAVATAME